MSHPRTMAEFEWSYDAAASGPRIRAHDTGYELVAYEDGRWFVHRDGFQVDGGKVASQDLARQATVFLFNLHTGRGAS